MNFNHNPVSTEIIKFLLVGLLNTVLGYSTFAGINYFFGPSIGYVGSVLLSHLLYSTVAFYLYRRKVFGARGKVLPDFFRFQAVYLLPLIVNIILLPALVELNHLNAFIAQAVLLPIITVASYFGHKYFSFRRK